MDIRERTEKKVFSYIEEHGMIAAGDKIVTGVSGGADSVCLLLMLLAYGKKTPLSLAVVHVNHGIRAEAEEDARYVEELCRRNGIPFFPVQEDVRGLALREGCSEEDAGRRVRYEAFRRAARQAGCSRIAVAHNANDNAETMLFHLFRGSGIKGIGGIAPVRKDADGMEVIRPILCLQRREVEEYLRQRRTAWRTDITNNSDDYSRNRIRHHILSYAEEEVVQGAAGHMCRTAGMLRETEDYLEEQTEEALKKCLIPEGGGGFVLDAESFGDFHIVLQKRMILSLMERLSPTGKDISAVHVLDVLTLFEREEHRRIVLPFGIEAWRQYGRVELNRRAGDDLGEETPGGAGSQGEIRSEESWRGEPRRVELGEEIFAKPVLCSLKGVGTMEISAFFIKKGQEVPRNQYTKWFDYDKIEKYVTFRSRCSGDFLTVADGSGGMNHKSLKNYMITEKIPRQRRDEIPVAAVGNHVLWLVGWRISEYFKVGENTERILQMRWIQE